MTDKKKNGWIKFVPSLTLTKERVSIAYDTHDERGVRYAYGYFQFYNGTCGCFWKDGNEQPKVVKAEDIKYWMPVPSLDVQEEPVEQNLSNVERIGKDWKEEPVSEELEKAAKRYSDNEDPICTCEECLIKTFKTGAMWQKEKMMVNATKVTVHIDAGGYPYIPQMELYDYDNDVPLAKEGDKYKVILIKEE